MGNKILDLSEVVQWGRGPIWVQEKGINIAMPVIYDLENCPFLRFKVCMTMKSDRHMKYVSKEYRKTWRCFETKPDDFYLRMPVLYFHFA